LPELLAFRAVDTYYGDLHVLKAVDYRIDAGEIVCLLGGNASGKSTTMKAIMGVVVPARGDIEFEGRSLAGVSVAERVRPGLGSAAPVPAHDCLRKPRNGGLYPRPRPRF
jgi:branched-chain amino acid transport system ATP-binding protein